MYLYIFVSTCVFLYTHIIHVIDSAQRYPYYVIYVDGCEANSTLIPSTSGDPELAITINWPEVSIGTTAYVDCPCGNLSLTSEEVRASRYCGGDFTHGAVWDEPHVADCNFSDLARNICRIASVSYKKDVVSKLVEVNREKLIQLLVFHRGGAKTQTRVTQAMAVYAQAN